MKLKKMNWGDFSKYRPQMFGVSIILIMISHFFEDAAHDSTDRIIGIMAKGFNFLIGSIGVEIFLFLSGMGLYFSMSKNSDTVVFYKKRFRRVLIPYLIWGTLFWVWKDIVIQHSSPLVFVSDFTTVTFWTKGNRNLWYVSFILIMYLLFPLLFKLLGKERKGRGVITWTSTVLIFLLTIALKFTVPNAYENIEVALFRIPIFIIGAYYGKAVAEKRDFTKAEYLLPVLGIAGKAFIPLQKIVLNDQFNYSRIVTCFFAFAVMIVIILISPLFTSGKIEKALLFCGKLSFELYITHVTIRTIMNIYGFRTFHPLNYIICILLSFASSIALSKLTDLILSSKKKDA